ncbi:MAG: thiolase family protein [Burkholderiaceae bacterium]
MNLRNAAVIAGVGESGIRPAPEMSGLALNALAIERALGDAGLALDDVDGLFTAYSMTEPYFMLGSVLAEYVGIQPRLATSVTVGGGSPGVLLHQAVMALATGQADVIVIATGENRATGVSRDAAVERLTAVGHPAFENPYGPLIPAFYAMVAQRYLFENELNRNDLAHVAVTSRLHAVMHPDSPMQSELTLDEVLQSKPIADPLRLYDCCLISDAAGALVLTRPERIPDLPKMPVHILGVAQYHSHEHLTMAPDDLTIGCRRSGQQAYAMAGVSPGDIQFAQLYDCFSVVPAMEAEALELVPAGGGLELFASGGARFDGRLPVNTHGGLMSYAQAGASGGMHGIIEAVRQIRGEAGARQVASHELGIVHNEGGILSSHATMVLAAQPG